MTKAHLKRLEFAILVILMIFTRAADLLITYHYSPDLQHEANPLVSFFQFHWQEFLFSSFLLTSFLSLCLYYDFFTSNTSYPKEKHLGFSDFASVHWFGRKRHLAYFLLAFAKDWDLRIKFIGYAGSRLLIFIGTIAALSWLGLSESKYFEAFYNFCFPAFPYIFIIFGAVYLLYSFLKKEYVAYQALQSET